MALLCEAALQGILTLCKPHSARSSADLRLSNNSWMSRHVCLLCGARCPTQQLPVLDWASACAVCSKGCSQAAGHFDPVLRVRLLLGCAQSLCGPCVMQCMASWRARLAELNLVPFASRPHISWVPAWHWCHRSEPVDATCRGAFVLYTQDAFVSWLMVCKAFCISD